jgi:hypothetical protein
MPELTLTVLHITDSISARAASIENPIRSSLNQPEGFSPRMMRAGNSPARSRPVLMADAGTPLCEAFDPSALGRRRALSPCWLFAHAMGGGAGSEIDLQESSS